MGHAHRRCESSSASPVSSSGVGGCRVSLGLSHLRTGDRPRVPGVYYTMFLDRPRVPGVYYTMFLEQRCR